MSRGTEMDLHEQPTQQAIERIAAAAMIWQWSIKGNRGLTMGLSSCTELPSGLPGSIISDAAGEAAKPDLTRGLVARAAFRMHLVDP